MTESVLRRLDAIAKALPPGLVDYLEQIAVQASAAEAIGTWVAGPDDFEIYLAPRLADLRQELIDAAVKHRDHEWSHGPPQVKEDRLHLLAAAAVDLAPGSPRQLEAIETLERDAVPPAEEFREHDDPWDSFWMSANTYLTVLGPDHGAALHLEAEPAMEAAREQWVASREQLATSIRKGRASRVEFYVWVQPDLQERRHRLLAEALDRRARRAEGESFDGSELQGFVAELISYFPDEVVPGDPLGVVLAARDQSPSPGTPVHEEWVEANEAWWVLGTDAGKAMRARLETMAKEVPPMEG